MSEIEPILRAIGAIAVIAGTILVVPRRRHLLYEGAEQHANGNWVGFDRSLEDFEVRNFANIYEQPGPLVLR